MDYRSLGRTGLQVSEICLGTMQFKWTTDMDDLIHQGKVRYIGCSNYAGWELMEATLVARQLGLHEYVSLQPHYSLVERANFEKNVLPVVKKFGVGVIPYSPLGRGFLTGKYRRNEPLPESGRINSVKPLLTDRNFNLLDKLEAIAQARGQTPGRIALAWLLSKDYISLVIIGANTPEQLADSLGASGLKLTPEETASLDEVSAPDK